MTIQYLRLMTQGLWVEHNLITIGFGTRCKRALAEGPIVEYGEDDFYRIIGIVSKYIPFVTKWHSSREQITNTELTNSGYTVCVPIQAAFDLIDKEVHQINVL